MEKNRQQEIKRLFHNWCGEQPEQINPLPHSGSDRHYYRILGRNSSAIAAYNPHQKENRVFFEMTRFFLSERIAVPKIYQKNDSETLYLLEDLGDTTLFSVIASKIESPENLPEIRTYLKQAIRELARIQVVAGRKMDFSICHPYSTFDASSVLFDLEYFRNHFLERQAFSYNKLRLKKDFQYLTNFIGEVENQYFMYRDFQSRNIMVNDGKLYFIDYQGGRKGPLQYDLASLLFQARARLPQHLREEMLNYYIQIVRMLTPIDIEEFLNYYYAITLIRVLQTLGAYGLRGLSQGREHFIQSIPYALKNLHVISEKNKILEHLPELANVIDRLKNDNTYTYE